MLELSIQGLSNVPQHILRNRNVGRKIKQDMFSHYRRINIISYSLGAFPVEIQCQKFIQENKHVDKWAKCGRKRAKNIKRLKCSFKNKPGDRWRHSDRGDTTLSVKREEDWGGGRCGTGSAERDGTLLLSASPLPAGHFNIHEANQGCLSLV